MTIYTKLAYQAIDQFIRHQTVLVLPHPLATDIAVQRACYVSIFEKPGRHFLSQSGDIHPRGPNLAADLIHHAIAAVQTSPKRLRRMDLPALQIEVLVLGPLQRISDPAQLNPFSNGLYLRSDLGQRSVILPNRPGINSAEIQLATAIREAGVNLNSQTVQFYRFNVEYYQ